MSLGHVKRSREKMGEKRFRALQTDRTTPCGDAAASAGPARDAPPGKTDMTICTSSLIRTMTVGSGVSPDLLTPRMMLARALAGSWFGREALPHTAGGELHPALKTY
ncbi:putative uncharacterized protein [Caballeronia insecticola]|uniref:Uncharacterized protein n=1 Tax=Caballeronia insecticola TaxID=758793 RepID=R4WFD4_9BURK|nr:putative uncharacterized protein [Caballeronia insecticola]